MSWLRIVKMNSIFAIVLAMEREGLKSKPMPASETEMMDYSISPGGFGVHWKKVE